MIFDSKSIHRTLRCLGLVLTLSLSAFPAAHAAPASCEKSWPAWDTFKKNLIDEDGRVVDSISDAMITTSEGQAYALFFALVANDRAMFDALLDWSEKNLAAYDLMMRLPSWQWGGEDEQARGVMDENSASDADLWMAYTLGEAGRLWADRRLVALSSLLADRILATETREVPGLGLVLLPGATGFTPSATRVRLNPSYVPLQLMRWFVTHSKDPRWTSLLNTSRRLIIDSAPEGYAPEWTIYDDDKGFMLDEDDERRGLGSYNAIRVYLWAGMMNTDDPDRRALLDALKPMARFVARHGYPPESINITTGVANNPGPAGFSAAMVPFLHAAGMNRAVKEQLLRIAAHPIPEDSYYSQVLNLYALGWHDKLYRFDLNGNLTPRWMSTCP